MKNTKASAPKRTRRTPEQWRAILTEHLAGEETAEDLARRLACKPSTIATHLKKLTDPTEAVTPNGKFVEVETRTAHSERDVRPVQIQTARGIVVTFASLPPADYLAAAIGAI